MEQTQLIEELMNFGLTRQEATVYLALYKNGTMSGYEVAKQTGISRSNAYNALAGLTDKGAAYMNNGSTVRYMAVAVDEFCANKIHTLTDMKEHLVSHIPGEKEVSEGYLTIENDVHIADKMRNMLKEAEQRVYITMPHHVLQGYMTELRKLIDKQIKVVVITDEEVELDGGKVYLTKCEDHQIGLITDSKNVLTGEYGKGMDSTCLYSEAKNFVQVFKGLLGNEIKLIEIARGEQ